ncbi:MAG: YlxR family protein [Motilibacteraceae bacterium]
MRTCVGCRERAPKPDLLRVVVVESEGVRAVEPDVRGRLPGRGASLHPDLRCLDLAERRRAFPRAFRLPGPLDSSAVRRFLEEQVEHDRRSTSSPAEAGGDADR